MIVPNLNPPLPYQRQFGAVLVAILALLYPLHVRISISGTGLNLSIGDPIVFVVMILVIGGIMPVSVFPRYTALGAAGLLTIASISLILKSVFPPGYFVPEDAMIELIKLVASISWFITAYALIYRQPRHRMWIFTLTTALVTIVTAGLAIFKYLSVGVSRATGTFANPNLFAFYLLFVAFLMFGWIKEMWKARPDIGQFYRIYYYHLKISLIAVAFVFSVFGIILTGSRAGLGALLLGFIACVNWRSVLNYVFHHPAFGTIGTSTGVVTITSILNSDLYVVDRFRAVLQGQQTGHRLQVWSRSLQGTLEYPLFGIGPGQDTHYIPSSPLLPRSPHNTFIFVFSELGLLGLLSAGMLVLILTRDGFRLRFGTRHTGTQYLIGFLVGALGYSMFHQIINFRSFWVAAAFITASSMIQK